MVITVNRTVLKAQKYRHELKYICSETQLRVIERKIQAVMRPDAHADGNGEYLIRSVYFDDYMRSSFYSNEDGTDPRAKFRVRIYNCSDGRISLEKKRKNRGMTGKDSCPLDRETCMRMLRGEPIRDRLGNVRITFDRNICASPQVESIFDPNISRVAVLPTGYHVLEVKYDDFLPDIIYQLIDDGHMVHSTFSKFYLGLKAMGGRINEFS